MQNEKKPKGLFLLGILSFVAKAYMKDIFAFLHMIISNMSPALFTFLMVLLVAIIIYCKKPRK